MNRSVLDQLVRAVLGAVAVALAQVILNVMLRLRRAGRYAGA